MRCGVGGKVVCVCPVCTLKLSAGPGRVIFFSFSQRQEPEGLPRGKKKKKKRRSFSPRNMDVESVTPLSVRLSQPGEGIKTGCEM